MLTKGQHCDHMVSLLWVLGPCTGVYPWWMLKHKYLYSCYEQIQNHTTWPLHWLQLKCSEVLNPYERQKLMSELINIKPECMYKCTSARTLSLSLSLSLTHTHTHTHTKKGHHEYTYFNQYFRHKIHMQYINSQDTTL